MTDKPVTQRGFRIFHDDPTVSVVESSLAFEGPHVRIYGGRDHNDHVHLNLDQARAVRDGLGRFIEEAVAEELTEIPDA